jgi:hypothetical protein
MNSPDKSTDLKALHAISHSVPGPDFLRYYPAHRLMAWQPQGTLDDLMLDQIADWLVDIEKVSPPFKRFIDFSRLTNVAVRTSHVFKVARRRAQQFTGVESVRTALSLKPHPEQFTISRHASARGGFLRSGSLRPLTRAKFPLKEVPCPPTGISVQTDGQHPQTRH